MSIREIDNGTKVYSKDNNASVKKTAGKDIGLLFSDTKTDNPLDDLAKISEANKKKEIKLLTDRLQDDIPLKERLIEAGKKTLICGGITYLLGSIINVAGPLCLAGLIGGALGSALVILHKHIKRRNSIKKLEKYFDKLKDEQKKEINKLITEDKSFAPHLIERYTKKCRKMYLENKWQIH